MTGMDEMNTGATVQLCMIMDEARVRPAAVAITSMLRTKRPESRYVLHMIDGGLTEASKQRLAALAADGLALRFVRGDAADLPALLPETDRVLLLAAEVIARGDLTELYQANLRGCAAAAVRHAEGANGAEAFDRGVMLLDLQAMRRKGLSWQSLPDRLILPLPLWFNCPPDCLKGPGEMGCNPWRADLADMLLLRFGGAWKPWEDPDGPRADLWLDNAACCPGDPADLSAEEGYGISVIMPCYNTAPYLQEAIDSLYAQTYQNFELIAIDDGSTDDSLAILRENAARHPGMQVIANTNHHQGYERNVGIGLATGRYVYYMDSDDRLHPDCFRRLYTCARTGDLDLVLFEGSSFYETADLQKKYPQYETLYSRRHAYLTVTTGAEQWKRSNKLGDKRIVSPCMQLVRRAFLTENGIRFPELPCLEDNLYFARVMLSAQRVRCLPDSFFMRRVRENSTMTREGRRMDEIRATGYLTGRLLALAEENRADPDLYRAVRSQALSLLDKCPVMPEGDPLSEAERAAVNESFPPDALLQELMRTRGELSQTKQRLREQMDRAVTDPRALRLIALLRRVKKILPGRK